MKLIVTGMGLWILPDAGDVCSEAQKLTTRSAATSASAKLLGVPHVAFLPCKSSSVTARALAQPPQTWIGMPCSMTLGSRSRSGGQPTPSIWSTMTSFIR